MNNALNIYMEQINSKRAIFGKEPLDLHADFDDIYVEVDALGSPEILSGDGELPIDMVEARTQLWNEAMDALDKIERDRKTN